MTSMVTVTVTVTHPFLLSQSSSMFDSPVSVHFSHSMCWSDFWHGELPLLLLLFHRCCWCQHYDDLRHHQCYPPNFSFSGARLERHDPGESPQWCDTFVSCHSHMHGDNRRHNCSLVVVVHVHYCSRCQSWPLFFFSCLTLMSRELVGAGLLNWLNCTRCWCVSGNVYACMCAFRFVSFMKIDLSSPLFLFVHVVTSLFAHADRACLTKSLGEMTLVFGGKNQAGQGYLFYGIITKSVQNLSKPWQMTTSSPAAFHRSYYSLENCYSFRLVLSKYIAILHYWHCWSPHGPSVCTSSPWSTQQPLKVWVSEWPLAWIFL